MEVPQFYRRRLPHWQPAYATFAITFRLYGALPADQLLALKKEFQGDTKNWHQPDWNNYFRKFDEILDHSKSGPKWLVEPVIAQVVMGTFHYWHEKSYRLIAYCIMSNHVHLMIDETKRPLFRILQSIKRYTARETNLLLDRTDQPFWQKETYDHVIRDEGDLTYQFNYLIQDPATAGIVTKWQDYPYTYLNPEFEEYCSAN